MPYHAMPSHKPRQRGIAFSLIPGLLLILSISVVIALRSYESGYDADLQAIQNRHFDSHKQMLQILNNRGDAISTHLMQLKLQLITGRYLDDNPSRTRLENLFHRSLQRSASVERLSWLDKQGREVAHIRRLLEDGQWQESVSEPLRDLSHQPAIRRALALEGNRIFTSPLQLSADTPARPNAAPAEHYQPRLQASITTHRNQEGLRPGLVRVSHNFAPTLQLLKQRLPEGLSLTLISPQSGWQLSTDSSLTGWRKQPLALRPADRPAAGVQPVPQPPEAQRSHLTLLPGQINPLHLSLVTEIQPETLQQLHRDNIWQAATHSGLSAGLMLLLAGIAFLSRHNKAVKGQELADLLDKAADPLFLLSRNNRLIYANQAGQQILQRRQISLHQAVTDLLPPDQLPPLGESRESQHLSDIPGQYYRIKRESLSLNKTRLQLLSLRDISAEKENLRQSALKAERLNQAKDQFLANMSHEIRTPISGVIGTLHLLQDTPLDSNQSGLLELSLQNAEAMLALLNNILDLSKINAGKTEVCNAPFSLNQLLDDVVGALGSKALEKGIQLLCPCHHLPPTRVTGDAQHIRQILLNLVANAIKFTDQGRVEVRAECTGCQLTLHVSDTGIGITQAQQRRLFQRFEQADSSTSRQYGGSGLGLVISKELAHCMHGTLTVSSEYGKGSCFTLQLPVKSEQHADQPTDLNHSNVLVLCSRERERQLLSELLSAWSLSARVVSSAARAYQLLTQACYSSRPFQLFIFDLQALQQEPGQLLQQIHADPGLRDLALLALSREHNVQNQQVSEQVDSLLYLPFTHSDLLDQIQRLLSPRASANSHAGGQRNAAKTDSDQHSLPQLQGLVLVVEDNRTNQLITRALLQKLGLDCEVCDNGQQALQALHQKRYDLVLMDCQMPVLDGYQATRAFRQQKGGASPVHTPVIALTANAMKGDRETCLAAGMDAYLSKPLNLPELVRSLSRYLPAAETAPQSQPKPQPSDRRFAESASGRSAALGSANTLPVFDYPALYVRLDQDLPLLQQVVQVFLQDLDALVRDLHQQSRTTADTEPGQRLQNLCLQLHNLKGAAANLEAQQLRESAGQLQQQIQQSWNTHKSFDYILQAGTDTLNRQLQELKQEIHQRLNTTRNR